MQSKIDEIKKGLAELPKAMENDPSAEVINMINEFCQGLRMTVNGKGGEKSFIQRNRAIYKIFKEMIWATAPDFRPFENASKYDKPSTYNTTDSEGASDGQMGTPLVMGLYDVRRVIEG